MQRLDRFLGRHRRAALAGWVIAVLVAAPFAARHTEELTGAFDVLTRIRERWFERGDTQAAVAEALSSSARTITAAAVTIAAVFATFVFAGVSTVQQTGLGCAVAILIDATLVRLVLVPATMRLLGERNWWQPFSRGPARRPVRPRSAQ